MVPKVFISMLPRSCSGAIIKHRTISTTLKEVYGSCYRERNFAGALMTLLCLSWRTVDNGDQRWTFCLLLVLTVWVLRDISA